MLAMVLVQLITINHPGYAQSSGCYGFGSGNSEEAHDVIELSDGDLVVAGEKDVNGKDAYLIRFTPGSQAVQWEKTYNNSNSKEDAAKALVKKNNGDIYMAGYTKTDGDKDILIARINPSDGTLDNASYLGNSNPDVANDIIETSDGDLAITGNTKTTGSGAELSYVLEFTLPNSGSLTIQREFATGTGSGNVGSSLVQDSENDFWVVGEDQNNSGSGLIYQLDQTFTNNTTSDIVYRALVNGGSNGQTLKGIDQAGSSVIAVGNGKFNGTSKRGAFAIKLDETTTASGSNVDNAVQAFKQYTSSNTNKLDDLTANSGGYTFTGENTNNNNLLSFQVTTNLSNINWNQVMGGSSTDFGNAIIKNNGGGFLSVGKSQSSDFGGNNFFLTRLSSSGASCCGNQRSLTTEDLTASGTVNGDGNLSNSTFKTAQSNLSSNEQSLSLSSSSSSGSFTSGGDNCGALPVEFAGFQLDQAGSSAVNIAWSTASETQNNYFTVLRSRSGDNFRSVGRKDGQGTKLTSTEYTLVDDVPRLNATYYYKIRQTDFDGTTSCSNIKAIELGKRSASDLSISHVTTQGNTLAAHLKGSAEGAQTVQLMNSLGQQVARQQLNGIKGEQSLQFNLNQRARQMLYLRIIDQQTGELIANKKVVATTK